MDNCTHATISYDDLTSLTAKCGLYLGHLLKCKNKLWGRLRERGYGGSFQWHVLHVAHGILLPYSTRKISAGLLGHTVQILTAASGSSS